MRAALILGTLVALVAASFFFDTGSVHAQTEDRWVVRLYDGGKVVGTWEALGPGRMDGDSLLFTVEQGVRAREVRVAGTWSLEPLPR